MVLIFDAAQDRLVDRFYQAVDIARLGVALAQNPKAFASWNRSRPRTKVGLTGDALEAAVMRIAQMFPDNVVRGTI